MFTTRKFAEINGAGNKWRRLQNNTSCILPYLAGHEEFENLCFISVAQIVWVSHAFVYGAVNVNKIVTFFRKISFIHICEIDYTAKSIAYFIPQSLVNTLVKNPTV